MNNEIDQVIIDKLAKIRKYKHDLGFSDLDEEFLLAYMYYMRFSDIGISTHKLDLIIKCLKAGINPEEIGEIYISFHQTCSEFEAKAIKSLNAKKNQARRKIVEQFDKNNKKFRQVYITYQVELQKKKKGLPAKTLHNLLEDKFKRTIGKHPERLESIKVQYHRIKNKIENPKIEKLDDQEIKDKIITYLLERTFVIHREDPNTGENMALKTEVKIGNRRSLFARAVNKEKDEDAANQATLKKLQSINQ